MSDYFVSSAGSNTAPYNTWAKAATGLQTALTAATADGDRVIIDTAGVPSGDKEVAADTNWQTAGNVSVICSTNTGTSTVTPTAMGTSTWIGNSTTSFHTRFSSSANGKRVYTYGLTIRNGGSTGKILGLNTSNFVQFVFDNCCLWAGCTATTAITIGPTGNDGGSTVFRDCTLRTAATGTGLEASGRIAFENLTVSNASSAVPATLFVNSDSGDDATVDCMGCDLSLVTGTLVGNNFLSHKTFTFRQSKLGAGVTVLAAQTFGLEHIVATVLDCDSGNVHYSFGHYTPLGSTVASASIYANTGGASYDIAGDKLSWLVNSTSIASENVPYVSPWITCYNEGVAAVTPYFECVRSGSATAYNDNEVWAEFTYKGTSSSTQCSFNRTDHGTGSAQTTSSLSGSDWTGESGTAWFGKLNPTGTITPVAIGDIAARVIVGKASVTDLYVDPQIRGI